MSYRVGEIIKQERSRWTCYICLDIKLKMTWLSESRKPGGNTTARAAPEEFKRMAVELSQAKGSLKATAQELGVTPQILTRWCRERVAAQVTGAGSRAQVSQEQQEILRLKKESLRRPG